MSCEGSEGTKELNQELERCRKTVSRDKPEWRGGQSKKAERVTPAEAPGPVLLATYTWLKVQVEVPSCPKTHIAHLKRHWENASPFKI